MKKLLIPAILAILASCAQIEQEASQEPVVPEGYKVLTIQASKADFDADTKTSYAGDKIFSWNVGDKISVLCNNGASDVWKVFTATETAATSSFTATVDPSINLGPLNPADKKMAMYPADANHSFNPLVFSIPAERDFRAASGGHVESAIPMFAWGTDTHSYNFSNLAGAAKFVFKGLTCAAVKMTFTTANVKLNGTYTLHYDVYNVNNSSNVYWNADNGANASEKTVTYYADVVDGRATFYLPYATGGIWGYSTLKLYDAGTDAELYSNDHVNTINITKNRIAVLPTINVTSSAFGIYWAGVDAAENTVADRQAIRSMKATYDETYLYLLLDVDPTKLNLTHKYCHYIHLYATGGSGSYSKWSQTSTLCGSSAWGTYNGAIAFKNWDDEFYTSSLNAVSGSRWSYEVRIKRAKSSLLTDLTGVRLGVVFDDVYTDDGSNYDNLGGGTYGIIPAQGSAMYPVSAAPVPPADPLPESIISVGFTESSEEVINPERGLYKHFEYKFDGGVPGISIASASNFDEPLVLTIFYLKDYRNTGTLSDDVLNKVDAEWAAAKAKGKKIIARFAYEWDKSTPHEPSPANVLSQINGLADKFTKYEDVLFLVQAGFIGTYGEWYYKEDAFAWNPDGSNYENASSVLTQMLSKVPSSRQIAVRTPSYKRWHLHPDSINAPVDVISSWGTAPNQRIGYYNDGFRGSANDIGTFSSDLDRNWWYNQGEWVICGGESAYVYKDLNDNDSCDPGEKQAWIDDNLALADPDNTIAAIREQHFTYLHNAPSNILMDYWYGDGGEVSCGSNRMPDICKALGYRLVLGDVDFTYPALTSGSTVNYSIKIKNTGSARVIYPRPFKLVLVHSAGDPTVLVDNLGDVRNLAAGADYTTLSGSFDLAADVVNGDKLAIWLPDNAAGLQGTAAYSIHLANKEVKWENGYNVLWSF